MATRNDITGDSIKSKVSSKDYLNNFDDIFRKPKDKPESYIGTNKTRDMEGNSK